MANEMLTVSQTSTYSLDQDDNLYIAAGLSIMVLNANGIRTTLASSDNTSAHIDGTVVAVGSFSALFLSGTDAGIGSHFISIGESGLVRSTASSGILASGTGNQVINAGQIFALNTGISLGSGLGLVQNHGSISSGGTGIFSSGGTNTVSNDGTLVATGNGITFSSATGVNQIENTGLIRSVIGTGISLAGDTNTVTNDGTILAGGSAISLSGGTSNFVSNEGRIRGGLNGIVLSGGGTGTVVQNLGKITAHDDGIVSDSAASFTTNSGTITAGRDGIILTGAGIQKVQNTGQITALQDGIDASGTNANVRSMGSISAVANGISVSGLGSSLVNGGTIDAGGIGLLILKGGRAVNLGTIEAQIGLKVSGSGSVIRNAGTIDASETGILGFGESLKIFNSGTLLADIGIVAQDNSSQIINSGRIAADIGIRTTNVRTIINKGTIEATSLGLEASVGAGIQSELVNEGSIVSTGSGLFIQGSGSFSLTQSAKGSIVGGLTGISSSGVALNIVNHGAIQGDAQLAAIGTDSALNLQNYGLVSAHFGMAVSVSNNTADRVDNFGKIVGDIDLGGGNDTVFGAGLIDGDVRLGDGADLFDNRLGTQIGIILAGAGADTILGGASNERIDGGADADRISGGDGADTISGANGADVLGGGGGNDIFLFRNATEAGLGANADRISDFAAGADDIDLRAFMAGGSFIGAAGFGSVAGQVRYTVATGVLQGDVDGNGVADWEIVLTNKAAVTAADFLF